MAPTRSRVSSKKQQPDIGLYMECEDEDLAPAQKSVYTKAKAGYQSFNKKMEDYLKRMKGELILDDSDYFLFQVKHTIEAPPPPPRQPMLPPSYQAQPNTYLVVLPQHQAQQATVPSLPPPPPVKAGPGRPPKHAAPSVPSPLPVNKPAPRTRSGAKYVEPPPEPLPSQPVTRGTRSSRSVIANPPVSSPKPAVPTPAVYTPSAPTQAKYMAVKGISPIPPQMKPSESTAYGGLVAGMKNVKDAPLTTVNPSEPDSKEITIGKLTSFPSLIIVARPHLLSKSAAGNAQLERANLDVQVKGVLMFTPTKFTEWLIQKGLIHNKRNCRAHVTWQNFPVPLKLGMFSEVSKFPHSGGYVWIADCCPNVFVSVFHGSIFEGSPYPPTVLLKLLYHWACQTNVQNVLQWVKVDSTYVRNVYAVLRAVCSEAVREKYGKIGGATSKVEVGVISLGTSPQDSETRRVKFEVLGVMHHQTNHLRLRAIPPASQGEKNAKRRFARILGPLAEWVDKSSIIVTDYTVDKDTLHSLGFRHVQQSATTDEKPFNENVMGYLRRIVPKVFQNTLHHLSIPIIQQFLDELVWRERWGPIAAKAFNNMIADIAFLMDKNYKDGLLKRLIAVAENPFEAAPASVVEPSTSTSEAPITTSGIRTRKQKVKTEIDDVVELAVVTPPKRPFREKDVKSKEESNSVARWSEPQPKPSLSEEELVFLAKKGDGDITLEDYYYGTLTGDEFNTVDKKPVTDIRIKCSICLKSFSDSLLLMKHILLHYQVEPKIANNLRNVLQCDLCFTGFRTEKGIKAHLNAMHSPPSDKKHLICQICEKLFTSQAFLIHHMHQMHVAAELPYACGVCHMRSSSYETIVKHFTQDHRNGHHIFCPHCLISVILVQNGSVMKGNVMFYIQHILRHRRQTEDTQCNRCRLSFVNRLVLQRHQEIDHASFHFQPDVKPLPLEHKTTMPLPGNVIQPAYAAKAQKPSRKPGCFSMEKSFDALKFEAEMYLTCSECEGTFASPHHFVGSMSCSKCNYMTCCNQAMAEHETMAHDSSLSPPPLHPALLPSAMHCPCGFFTYSGDRLAKHLAECGRQTVYGNMENARAELRKPGGRKSQTTKPPDEPNMLNMLGLVRKSPEPVEKSLEEKDEIAENLNRLFHGTPPKEPAKAVEPRKGKRPAKSESISDGGKGRKKKKLNEEAAAVVVIEDESAPKAAIDITAEADNRGNTRKESSEKPAEVSCSTMDNSLTTAAETEPAAPDEGEILIDSTRNENDPSKDETSDFVRKVHLEPVASSANADTFLAECTKEKVAESAEQSEEISVQYSTMTSEDEHCRDADNGERSEEPSATESSLNCNDINMGVAKEKADVMVDIEEGETSVEDRKEDDDVENLEKSYGNIKQAIDDSAMKEADSEKASEDKNCSSTEELPAKEIEVDKDTPNREKVCEPMEVDDENSGKVNASVLMEVDTDSTERNEIKETSLDKPCDDAELTEVVTAEEDNGTMFDNEARDKQLVADDVTVAIETLGDGVDLNKKEESCDTEESNRNDGTEQTWLDEAKEETSEESHGVDEMRLNEANSEMVSEVDKGEETSKLNVTVDQASKEHGTVDITLDCEIFEKVDTEKVASASNLDMMDEISSADDERSEGGEILYEEAIGEKHVAIEQKSEEPLNVGSVPGIEGAGKVDAMHETSEIEKIYVGAIDIDASDRSSEEPLNVDEGKEGIEQATLTTKLGVIEETSNVGVGITENLEKNDEAEDETNSNQTSKESFSVDVTAKIGVASKGDAEEVTSTSKLDLMDDASNLGDERCEERDKNDDTMGIIKISSDQTPKEPFIVDMPTGIGMGGKVDYGQATVTSKLDQMDETSNLGGQIPEERDENDEAKERDENDEAKDETNISSNETTKEPFSADETADIDMEDKVDIGQVTVTSKLDLIDETSNLGHNIPEERHENDEAMDESNITGNETTKEPFNADETADIDMEGKVGIGQATVTSKLDLMDETLNSGGQIPEERDENDEAKDKTNISSNETTKEPFSADETADIDMEDKVGIGKVTLTSKLDLMDETSNSGRHIPEERHENDEAMDDTSITSYEKTKEPFSADKTAGIEVTDKEGIKQASSTLKLDETSNVAVGGSSEESKKNEQGMVETQRPGYDHSKKNFNVDARAEIKFAYKVEIEQATSAADFSLVSEPYHSDDETSEEIKKFEIEEKSKAVSDPAKSFSEDDDLEISATKTGDESVTEPSRILDEIKESIAESLEEEKIKTLGVVQEVEALKRGDDASGEVSNLVDEVPAGSTVMESGILIEELESMINAVSDLIPEQQAEKATDEAEEPTLEDNSSCP